MPAHIRPRPPAAPDWAAAEALLAAAGVRAPAAQVDALVSHVLGLPPGADPRAPAQPWTPRAAADLAALLRRRAAREPLEHLTGRAVFRGMHLHVGPGVFVPQPETSAVVDFVVAALARDGSPVVVDLCTGAGTVALAVAAEVPGARVHAVERDPAALAWARRNADARAAAGDPPVALHQGDAADALPELDGAVDAVVSNPPYVAVGEAHVPDPEVVHHDPGVALWAGHDGLDVVRAVESAARRLLRPGGLLVVEHSDRQGVSAPALLAARGGWADVADHRDHDGLDRFVTARRDPRRR